MTAERLVLLAVDAEVEVLHASVGVVHQAILRLGVGDGLAGELALGRIELPGADLGIVGRSRRQRGYSKQGDRKQKLPHSVFSV